MRVVVVDGHPVTRTGLKTVLDAEEDIRIVGETGSGGEALRLIAGVEPDLVVLGLNLEGEPDGVEVCRQIKTMSDTPYVLILAAYNFAEAMSPSFLAGADSYLHKRSSGEVLLEAVRRTAAGEKVWEVAERTGEPKSIVRIPPDHTRLTPRELEVLELKLRRRTNREIAGALGISLDTAKHHVTSIYRKMGRSGRDILWP